ncbi:MAG: hypothetical protein AAGE52_26885 [Myxococcota bacterium]
MDRERLAEIDRQIEELGTPDTQVAVPASLALAEVDQLLAELADGVDVALPEATELIDAASVREAEAPAADPLEIVEAVEPEPETPEGGESTDDDDPEIIVSAPEPEPAPTPSVIPPPPPAPAGLDADDLFSDVGTGETSQPVDMSHLESRDDFESDEATGLFSQEDIEAIRRSSAPPPGEEPFPDVEVSMRPSRPPRPRTVPPPVPSVPPPTDAPIPPPDPAPVSEAQSLDDEIDDLILDDDDFELMIEDDEEEDEATVIATSPLLEEEAAAADGEEGEEGEDGDKKGFFKKLFG